MKGTKRTGVECPECLTPHAELRSGSWRCNNGVAERGETYLICGARGTVMPDGSLGVLRGGAHPMSRDADGNLIERTR